MKGLSVQFVVHRLRQRPDPFVHVVVLPDHHLFRNQRKVRLRQFGIGVRYTFHGVSDIPIRLSNVFVGVAAQHLQGRPGGIHRHHIHLIHAPARYPHSFADKNRFVHRPGADCGDHLTIDYIKPADFIPKAEKLPVQLIAHPLRQFSRFRLQRRGHPFKPFVHAVVVQDHHLLRDEEQIFLRHGGGGICYAFHREADIPVFLHDVLIRIVAQVLHNRSGGIHLRNVHLICPAPGYSHAISHENRFVHRPGTDCGDHLAALAHVEPADLIRQMDRLAMQLVIHRLRQPVCRSRRRVRRHGRLFRYLSIALEGCLA